MQKQAKNSSRPVDTGKEEEISDSGVADTGKLMERTSTEQITDLVTSLSDEDKKALATELARNVLNNDANKAAVVEAVKTATGEAKNEVVANAVSAAPLEAKKAAVAEAVKTAVDGDKKTIAEEAMKNLSSKQQEEIADQFGPDQDTTNEVWLIVVGTFKWVLWGSTLALVAAIGVGLFREVDQALVQILLTVFTTVAGIFAGFIGGKALSSSTGK